MRHLIIISAVLGMLAFQSCATQGSTTDQTLNLDLSGTWTLTYIDETSGTNIDEGFPNKKPTLTLEAISKKLTGNTGCNQMFGSFTTQQNKVSFSGIGTTKMYCEGVKEAEYLEMFNSIHSYKILDNQLIFMDSDGKDILKYSK